MVYIRCLNSRPVLSDFLAVESRDITSASNARLMKDHLKKIFSKMYLCVAAYSCVFVYRPCYLDNEYLDDRSQIKVHTDERTYRSAAPGLPWWSPFQVLIEVDVT